MEIRRFTRDDSTEIWELLNRLADDAQDYAQQESAAAVAAGPRIASGKLSYGQRSGTLFQATVQFPSGRFTSPPAVVATISNTAGGSQQLKVLIDQVSTTHFRLTFMRSDRQALSGHWCTAEWIAIGA